MRDAFRIFIAGLAAFAFMTLSGPASAHAPIKQIKLTEKQVQGFIAAQKDMNAMADKLEGAAGDTPDPAVQAELEAAEQNLPQSEEAREQISALKEQLAKANAKRKWVAFVDPIDVRFNSLREQPVPTSQAVIFRLIDVSGPMGRRAKQHAQSLQCALTLLL